jgi:type IV pilus assembly protein PilB
MAKEKKKLGQMLIDEGFIDNTQLQAALSYQREWGGRLGAIFLKKGFISEKDMIAVLEKQLGIKCISIESYGKPSHDVLNMVRLDIAKKHTIFPVKFEKNLLLLAISDPTDLKSLDDLNFMLGVRIKPLLALESDIQKAIAIHYEGIEDYGKSHVIDKERMIERITSSMHTVEDSKPGQSAPAPERIQEKSGTSRRERSQKLIIESVIDLLISKGIFTREELLNYIKSKE